MFNKGNRKKKMGLSMHVVHYAVITVAVILAFHLVGVMVLHTPLTNAIMLFAVIAVADVLFHRLSGYD